MTGNLLLSPFDRIALNEIFDPLRYFEQINEVPIKWSFPFNRGFSLCVFSEKNYSKKEKYRFGLVNNVHPLSNQAKVLSQFG